MLKIPLIELNSVDCSYFVRKNRIALKQVKALKNLNMVLHEGETLGVIGHNGAGKSTLLQVIAGILMPTKGTVNAKPNLSISLLTLQLGFSQELSGKENAVLGAMFLGFSRKESLARIERIMEFAELGQWADDPLRTYSTGMRARLGFAVAMEMEPDIMLIDEILGVGDSYFQKKSSSKLIEKMQSGQTTVLVSHSEGTMRDLCSRILWLHEGSVRLEGAPEAVLDAYNVWVAQK